LDFLQLQYKPPFPLDAVIASSILERYDRIFLFLLRLFRMQYIVAQLFRDSSSKTSYSQGINPLSERFRIEAHHFVTAICGYVFHVCIEENWYSFQHELDSIEASLKTRRPVPSIRDVRDVHARVLERISYCCFLKRRQQPILTLLYGTFEPILLFAKVSRMHSRREQRIWARMREEMEDNTKILHAQFMKRAGMFVRVIQQLERKETGKVELLGNVKGERHEDGWFADLLIRLDGSYFDR